MGTKTLPFLAHRMISTCTGCFNCNYRELMRLFYFGAIVYYGIRMNFTMYMVGLLSLALSIGNQFKNGYLVLTFNAWQSFLYLFRGEYFLSSNNF